MNVLAWVIVMGLWTGSAWASAPKVPSQIETELQNLRMSKTQTDQALVAAQARVTALQALQLRLAGAIEILEKLRGPAPTEKSSK